MVDEAYDGREAGVGAEMGVGVGAGTGADAGDRTGLGPGEQDDAAAARERDRLDAARLCDYLARARFETTTLGRRGYQQDEVNAFLERLAEAVQGGQPLADLVRRHRFTTVRAEDGYDVGQVDRFLSAVVDLDPHATAPRPEVGRSGLVTKLFG